MPIGKVLHLTEIGILAVLGPFFRGFGLPLLRYIFNFEFTETLQTLSICSKFVTTLDGNFFFPFVNFEDANA